MTDPLTKDTESLQALRREIDAVDAEMHRLLMRRGEVIERLIVAKRDAPAGSAFRPDREADMIARLAARHSGRLPLATVEHIWREIIGTFTQLQAPFRVHAADTAKPGMRDLLRFHFGFATPLVDQPGPAEVIAGVRSGARDLGVVAIEASGTAWWRALDAGPDGVKAIATLPFLTGADGWPRSLVVGASAIANPAADVALYTAAADRAPPPGRLSDDVEIVAAVGGEILIACHGPAEAIPAAAETAGFDLTGLKTVGDYCAPPSQASGQR